MSADDTPEFVSVIVPAFNSANFLRASVGSVLSQTWTSFECIVVDDGSTDNTASVVAEFADPRLKYHRKENEETAAATRNYGAEVATGAFLAFLDADDLWLPTKLEKQMELISTRELGLVYCAYAITDEDLSPLTVIIPERRSDLFLRTVLAECNGIAAGSTMLIRTAVFRACGGYRTNLSVSEDTELSSRAAARYSADGVDECLVLYRSHPNQGHLRLTAFEHDSLWILHDRFGEDPEKSKLLKRGLANLYTRLFYYNLFRRRFRSSLEHLTLALRYGPKRFVSLPLEAGARKLKRKPVSVKFRSSYIHK